MTKFFMAIAFFGAALTLVSIFLALWASTLPFAAKLTGTGLILMFVGILSAIAHEELS